VGFDADAVLPPLGIRPHAAPNDASIASAPGSLESTGPSLIDGILRNETLLALAA
jgi:hypothetical protein